MICCYGGGRILCMNKEINRMLAEEKPGKIYMAKLPRNPRSGNGAGTGRYFLRVWKKGYVTERLQWKCRRNDIEIIEVLGKGLSMECSVCGADAVSGAYTVSGASCGKQRKNIYDSFKCQNCGHEADRKVNAARNALNRGKTGRQFNKEFPKDNPMD